MHSHNFNKDLKWYSSCFSKYRSIFIESNEYEELIVGNSSNPFLNKPEFFQKQKSTYNWAARVYSNFELVGLSSKDNNALILKDSSVFNNDLTFEIKWIANEWILLKIEDLYWQVELSFKKKSEYESILMDCPGFSECISYYPNDYLFLVNQRSIEIVMPHSFRTITNFRLTKWERFILNIDENFFSLGLNEIRAFWGTLSKDWYIKILTSKKVLKKIWKNNVIREIIRLNPIDSISIRNIGNITISRDCFIVFRSLSQYCYFFTSDMYVDVVIDNNGERLHWKEFDEISWKDKINWAWLQRIKVESLLP